MLYGDASALVKLVAPEPESGAVRLYVANRVVASSIIVRVELFRAAARYGATVVSQAMTLLETLRLIDLTYAIADAAARIQPPTVRSLDAIHLATALSLGTDLDALVTYDSRMHEAAIALGLTVEAPA